MNIIKNYICLVAGDGKSEINKDIMFDSPDRPKNIREIEERAKPLFRKNYSTLDRAISPLSFFCHFILEVLKNINLKLILCLSLLKKYNQRNIIGLYKKTFSLEILFFIIISWALKEEYLNCSLHDTAGESGESC